MKKSSAGSKLANSLTGDTSVADRLDQLASREQQRIEAERQPPVALSATSPATGLPDSRLEPSYRQLTESVSLLRDFCRELEHKSAYLSVRLTHTKSSAEAEFIVGNVDEMKFWDSKPDWAAISLLRTVRIGNVRENYEHTKGVAEIVEIGEVLRRAADLRAYLNDKLLAEIAQAVGRWRADDDRHIRDEPGAKEELPLNLAILQCGVLLDGISKRLAADESSGGYIRARHAAERAVLEDVKARLHKLCSEYGFENDWPSVLVSANFAWLTSTVQVLRVRDLVHIAAGEVRRYADEQAAKAKEAESDLEKAQANSDELADEAFYDMGLEKRLERKLEEIAEEFDDHRFAAGSALEVADELDAVLTMLDESLPELVAAVAAHRATVSASTMTTSTEPTWTFKD